MASFYRFVLRSKPAQVGLTLVIYAFYACVLGVSIVPSALCILTARSLLFPPDGAGRAVPVLLLCLCLGAAVFIFIFCSLLISGVVIRLLSLGVRPGKHQLASRPALCWMVLNGLHTICFRAILPLVPSSFLALMYFRLAGCRIGRGVWLTTTFLLDPYLISIGDGTVIGGDAVITAHLFENGVLSLAPIRIGRRCMVGAHALISPGVTIEDGAVVGMRAYVREGRRIPRGSRIASMAGLPAERLLDLERQIRRPVPRRSGAPRR